MNGQVRLAWLLVVGLVLGSAPSARGDNLPPPLQEWLGNEQGRISRSVDLTRIMALTNKQDPRYSPERGGTFAVKSYWIDASKMRAFAGAGLDAGLKTVLTRTHQGKAQVRLLVHPESEALYRTFLQQHGARAGDFKATATASSRTLMVWPKGKPNRAFFAKLSLDKMIGRVRRTVSQGEVTRSVGINNVLHLAQQKR